MCFFLCFCKWSFLISPVPLYCSQSCHACILSCLAQLFPHLLVSLSSYILLCVQSRIQQCIISSYAVFWFCFSSKVLLSLHFFFFFVLWQKGGEKKFYFWSTLCQTAFWFQTSYWPWESASLNTPVNKQDLDVCWDRWCVWGAGNRGPTVARIIQEYKPKTVPKLNCIWFF